MKTVGQRIRTERQRQEMTLDQLAGATGLSRAGLSKIERDLSDPRLGSLQAISKALGRDLDWTLNGERVRT